MEEERKTRPELKAFLLICIPPAHGVYRIWAWTDLGRYHVKLGTQSDSGYQVFGRSAFDFHCRHLKSPRNSFPSTTRFLPPTYIHLSRNSPTWTFSSAQGTYFFMIHILVAAVADSRLLARPLGRPRLGSGSQEYYGGRTATKRPHGSPCSRSRAPSRSAAGVSRGHVRAEQGIEVRTVLVEGLVRSVDSSSFYTEQSLEPSMQRYAAAHHVSSPRGSRIRTYSRSTRAPSGTKGLSSHTSPSTVGSLEDGFCKLQVLPPLAGASLSLRPRSSNLPQQFNVLLIQNMISKVLRGTHSPSDLRKPLEEV